MHAPATTPTTKLADTGIHISARPEAPARELAHRIAGVTQKMLTQTVRTLERDGLVTRTVTASVPVRVDYELTPLGHELFPVMIAIKN